MILGDMGAEIIKVEKPGMSAIRRGLVLHFVSKNDTDVAHYSYDVHEGILIIFGRYFTTKISN